MNESVAMFTVTFGQAILNLAMIFLAFIGLANVILRVLWRPRYTPIGKITGKLYRAVRFFALDLIDDGNRL